MSKNYFLELVEELKDFIAQANNVLKESLEQNPKKLLMKKEIKLQWQHTK